MPFVLRVSVGIGLSLLSTAGAEELTEQEAVRRFLAHSPLVRELRQGVAVVEAEALGRSLRPNPSASYAREEAGRAEFWQVGGTLPVSGRLGLIRRAGAAAVNVAEEQSGYALWQLRSDLRSFFYEVLLAQEREGVIRRGIDELKEIVRILRDREKEGEGSKFDRLRAERELPEVRAELVSAQVALAQARARLASFFRPGGEPGPARVRGGFENSSRLPPLPDLLDRAARNRGDYKAHQRQREQVNWEGRAAERLRIPEPVVTAGLKRADAPGRNVSGPVVALSVPIPLFNRGQTEVARLRSELERIGTRQQILEQRIRSEVQAAYAAAELRRGIAAEYRQGLAAEGSELQRIAESAYEEGELGILQLLDAYRVNRQSQLKAWELAAAAKQAEIDLDRVVGEEVLP